MLIQTLEMQKDDLNKERQDSDKLVTQMTHEINSLRAEKAHLQELL
jgi:peptidoglycan hydrolase CwlO-like protein